jgi:hypothetical protein
MIGKTVREQERKEKECKREALGVNAGVSTGNLIVLNISPERDKAIKESRCRGM